MGLGSVPVLPVEAISWVNWKTAAVGDIATPYLGGHWSFTSSPKSGYENYLWDYWTDVLYSQGDYSNTGDLEIVFDTTGDSSTMCYLTMESKMEMTGANLLRFRGRYGCRFSYSGVRTVGYVRIYDKTDDTVFYTDDIETSGTANQWSWNTFDSDKNIIELGHNYVIKLFAKDAWISQTVQVAFESAEPWVHAPYYRTLNEYYRTSTTCRWRSDFKFKQGAIDDLLRDHRPYVMEDDGNYWMAYGWDPCYSHEFQSEPYTLLEANGWYSTNLPGVVQYTESDENEEQYDEYEEIEVSTRSVASLSADYPYYVKVGYNIMHDGTATVTLEAELGNEKDDRGLLDPPAMPVAWLELTDNQATYGGGGSDPTPDSYSLSDGTPISHTIQNDWIRVGLTGVYPYHLKMTTMVTRKAEEELSNFIDYQRTIVSGIDFQNMSDEYIPVTVTLGEPMTIKEFEGFADSYRIGLDKFRFAARNGDDLMQGQGVPNESGGVPKDVLSEYIEGGDLIGIHSFDGYVSPTMLYRLLDSDDVAIVDASALFALQSLDAELVDFYEVSWFSQDLAWIVNNGFK
ncbi:MAG: hypothetical protein ACOC38_05720 [Promethearchaeia archaeon]